MGSQPRICKTGLYLRLLHYETGRKQMLKEYSNCLELTFFGTFEARLDGVNLVQSLSTKGKALLSFIAIHSGRPIASALIAEEVFPDTRSGDPHEIIKKTVQEIRKVLGTESWRLKTPSNRTFSFEIEGAMLDWKNFHNSLNKGDEASLLHAISLHKRVFLENDPLPWAKAERTICLKLRQEALESLFRYAMNSSEQRNAASFLAQQFTFETPFLFVKEAHWCELFQFLLKRQEYGLLHHHYLLLKTFLERTSGRLPEQEINDLHQKIPKSSLVRILQVEERKKRSAFPGSARIPSFPFAMLGREKEMQELKQAIANFRLITIRGIGGIGKTRFAAAFAQQVSIDFNDETAFVDLTSATPSTLLPSFATALGVKHNADLTPYEAVKNRLSPKRTLLVFDNCEHIIAEIGELTSNLLGDCPKLIIIATSREALGLACERVFSLKSLKTPVETKVSFEDWNSFPALRLFEERAASVRLDFELSESNSRYVIELCQLVDGLPLGIEIIASQIANVPLSHIATILRGRVLHLKHRFKGVAAKHQTLVAALSWSYDSLSLEERTLFRRLSVFSGGWTLVDAEIVCADEGLLLENVLNLTVSLVEKSLAISLPTEQSSIRYDFPETVKLFANEQLILEGELKRFQFRHLNYFLSLAENAVGRFEGPEGGEWIARLSNEKENLRKSLEFCFSKMEAELDSPVNHESCDLGEKGLRLCGTLWRFWELQGCFQEGLSWLEIALKTSQTPKNEDAYANALKGAGILSELLGRFDKSRDYLERSLLSWRQLGNELEEAMTLDNLGIIYNRKGENKKAVASSEEALTILRRLQNPTKIIGTLNNLGIMARHDGKLKVARECFEEALTINRLHGNPAVMAKLIMNVASISWDEKCYEVALSLYEKSLKIFIDMKLPYDSSLCILNIANVALHKGDTSASKVRYLEGLEHMRRFGEVKGIIFCFKGLIVVASREFRNVFAATLFGATQAIIEEDAVFEQAQNPLEFEEILSLQQRMGFELFESYRLIGKSLTLDLAIERALNSGEE